MDDITTLLRALHDDDPNVRANAASMAGRTTDERVFEPLIALLQDDYSHVREASAHALGEIRDVRAVTPLCSILSGYADGRAAADALVKIGPPAVEQVIEVLNGKPDIIKARETAAEVLGRIGDTRAIPPLIAALHFPVGLRGQPAEKALVLIGAPAVESLGAAIREGIVGAADVLVKIGTPEAIDAQLNLLADENEAVRFYTACTLAECGSVQAIEVLVSELQSTDAYHRQQAIIALGKINHATILMPLYSALRDSDPDVRATALNVLGAIQVPPTAQVSPTVIESLIELSNDRNANVRYTATAVLCNAGASAVEPLIAYLNDERENVRKSAIRALGTIGDQRAVEPLRAALNDQSLWVRKEAESALKKLGWSGHS